MIRIILLPVCGVIATAAFWLTATPNDAVREPDAQSINLVPGPTMSNATDIARSNLLVAASCSGAEDLDVESALAVLDRWAESVEAETNRYLPRFQQSPAEYMDSEAYFRILVLVTVLQQDCGVRYNPDRTHDPDFTNSADLFIHGMIPAEGEATSGGTCVSMPVLYVAIGCRLGYPLFLVTTKSHVFARWDGDGERFNIEATNQGLNVYPDEHYHAWPQPLTPEEIESGMYLRSLTPDQELALFFAAKGHLLEDTGRLQQAIEAYDEAARLDPIVTHYHSFASACRRRMTSDDQSYQDESDDRP